jgi:DinB superfamily
MYLAYRNRIAPEQLKDQTIKLLEDYQQTLSASPAERLGRSPANGKWNGGEIAFHILRAAKATFRMCEGLRNNQPMADVPKDQAGKTKTVGRDDLLSRSTQLLELAKQFDYRSSTKNISSHPFFGPLNDKQWLVVNLIHLERHFKQLQNATQA